MKQDHTLPSFSQGAHHFGNQWVQLDEVLTQHVLYPPAST